MSISEKDKEFMERVADYFRSTKTPEEPEGSIRNTSIRFDINRNKVRKILVTMGEIESPITEEAMAFRKQGMSIKEIAEELGVSVATVSTALPYEDKVDNSLDPSEHAADVREYRAYEKERSKRQAGKNAVKTASEKNEMSSVLSMTGKKGKGNGMDAPEELKELLRAMKEVDTESDSREEEYRELAAKKDMSGEERERLDLLSFATGRFPGALNDRNRKVLEEIAGDRLPPEPMEVFRLHMELYSEWQDDETVEILKKYGKLEHGNCISRDIIVPGDIPLYALHYVMQRAFGWQNSHLRQFELPEDCFKAITDGNASMWTCLVGVLFRSPLMDENDEFWADDYNGGSFKNWLRKKYTGPYLSQCHGEGILTCKEDMMRLDMDAEYYVMYATAFNRETLKYEGEEYVAEAFPVYDHKGNRWPEPKPWYSEEVPYRVEVVKFEDMPSEGLKFLFERNPMALLERLPIDSVLAAGKMSLPVDCSDKERQYIDKQMTFSGKVVYQQAWEYLDRIIKTQIDSPEMQVLPMPVTDTLLYNYDFGDNWQIRITASENCPDLVESGRITQTELDRANVKCREVYRPVLIARDGEMLVDDVGGLHGFADFLQKINPDLKAMDQEEKEAARQEKRECMTWAKSLGWHREKFTDFNLL